MTPQSPNAFRRRSLLAAGAGALALALPFGREAAARAILQRGMSGGGLAQLDGSQEPRLANFGLFASAMQLPEGTTLVLGAIQWIEAGANVQLQSIEVTQCVPMDNRSDGAEVRGRMRANGKGDYPFVINVIDGGVPGSGFDRIEVAVNTPLARSGAASKPSDETFMYEAAGNLVAGDLQWIIADIDIGS
ncbi:MAG TPA: hypothetical protein VFI22_00530 [Thermomicrobiales bacterium]|nr:hypothetical protein [Thermomicrobiales bacterium]